MKTILLLCLILVAACVPAKITAFGPDGAICVLERKPEKIVDVSVHGGARVMEATTLRLDGQDLSSVDVRCVPRAGGLDCRLGSISSTVMQVVGSSVGGQMWFYRAGSDKPYIAQCTVRR